MGGEVKEEIVSTVMTYLTHQLNCSLHSAPKARDVKAWANGPGYPWNYGRSAEGAE
jgi:hypothetical protein